MSSYWTPKRQSVIILKLPKTTKNTMNTSTQLLHTKTHKTRYFPFIQNQVRTYLQSVRSTCQPNHSENPLSERQKIREIVQNIQKQSNSSKKGFESSYVNQLKTKYRRRHAITQGRKKNCFSLCDLNKEEYQHTVEELNKSHASKMNEDKQQSTGSKRSSKIKEILRIRLKPKPKFNPKALIVEKKKQIKKIIDQTKIPSIKEQSQKDIQGWTKQIIEAAHNEPFENDLQNF